MRTALLGIYHMLKSNQPWRDLGVTYFDELNHDRVVKRLCKRLEKLGYSVQLDAVASRTWE